MTAVPVPSAVLRATATEIRENANAATPGRWEFGTRDEDDYWLPGAVDSRGMWVAECAPIAAVDASGEDGWLNARHITSWDPATAHTVADLLDLSADSYDAAVKACTEVNADSEGGTALEPGDILPATFPAAMAICRAYNRDAS